MKGAYQELALSRICENCLAATSKSASEEMKGAYQELALLLILRIGIDLVRTAVPVFLFPGRLPQARGERDPRP